MAHPAHSTGHKHGEGGGRPYLLFWINMGLGLAVMYIVMFSMIDSSRDFRNNLNMFYMALTMWAPWGSSCSPPCRECSPGGALTLRSMRSSSQ